MDGKIGPSPPEYNLIVVYYNTSPFPRNTMNNSEIK